MKSLFLIFLFSICAVQSGFSQTNDFSINLNSVDKQKYLAVGVITSTVGYKIYHDYYKSIDPKSAHKKAFVASTITTLGIGLLKETLDYTQTGFNWNADDYGKDLMTAVMGGCAITITIVCFNKLNISLRDCLFVKKTTIYKVLMDVVQEKDETTI